jgi:glucose-6-phosphate 1-dehydrogenase
MCPDGSRILIERMVLFGATGDLTGRFLLPGLARLRAGRRLPTSFFLVGCGRDDWGDEEFRKHAEAQLSEHAADVAADDRNWLLAALAYQRVDFDDIDSVRLVMQAALGDPEPVVAYLALPSAVFPAAVRALRAVGVPPGSRVALEKPFGEDLDSARALNSQLMELTGGRDEQAIFRVDHVLAMATVQNLLGIRLANRVLEPVWNSAHVEQVDILWDETLGLEGRASYYDRTGALKDVAQNHLLQVLCLVAMEPPISLDQRDLANRKVDVLRSVRPLTPEQVKSRTRRARYTAGVSAETGESLPRYIDEEGVNADRNTETYAEIVLGVDNWRWHGTRFRLRSGKALAARRKEVAVRFRPVPPLPFREAGDELTRNELVIGIDGPYGLSMDLTGMVSGPPSHLAPLSFDKTLSEPELPPYSRVLLDVLTGDCRLSIRGDEAEESWRVMTPILQGWAENLVPMQEYPAGSAGPPPIA